ncbi:MAG: hypothetical protein V1834_04070 [Candidatus Micrarchaeota archaeon]
MAQREERELKPTPAEKERIKRGRQQAVKKNIAKLLLATHLAAFTAGAFATEKLLVPFQKKQAANAEYYRQVQRLSFADEWGRVSPLFASRPSPTVLRGVESLGLPIHDVINTLNIYMRNNKLNQREITRLEGQRQNEPERVGNIIKILTFGLQNPEAAEALRLHGANFYVHSALFDMPADFYEFKEALKK